jgi:hypothetical protein
MMARLFGRKGLPIRLGVVGDHVVVVGSARDGLAEEVVARVKGPTAGPLPAFADALRHAPDALFLARFDLLQFRDQYAAMRNAMMSDRVRRILGESAVDDAFFLPGLPKTLEPMLLAASSDDAGVHVRLRVDGRLLAHFAAQRDEDSKDRARYRAGMVGMEIRRWQQENGTKRLPSDKEVEAPGPDPWGERYRVEAKGDEFRVVSAGPDGAFGTADDVVADYDDPAASEFPPFEEPEIPLEEPEPEIEEPGSD